MRLVFKVPTRAVPFPSMWLCLPLVELPEAPGPPQGTWVVPDFGKPLPSRISTGEESPVACSLSCMGPRTIGEASGLTAVQAQVATVSETQGLWGGASDRAGGGLWALAPHPTPPLDGSGRDLHGPLGRPP